VMIMMLLMVGRLGGLLRSRRRTISTRTMTAPLMMDKRLGGICSLLILYQEGLLQSC